MRSSAGKIVLVVGASSGIGRACAVHLVRCGYRVFGTTRRSSDDVEATLREGLDAPDRLEILRMDVDDEASVIAGIGEVEERSGRIDAVINCAGFGFGGAIEDTSDDEAKATFETNWLSEALSLTDGMIALFGDSGEEKGGFFFTGSDSERLIARTKEIYDGGVPSGNSVSALCLLKLARMTGRADLESASDELLKEFSGALAGAPAAHTQMAIALDFALGPGREFVIAGRMEEPETRAMISELSERFMPGAVMMFRPAKEGRIPKFAPMLKEMRPVDKRTTAYICRDFMCGNPAVGIDELKKRLSEMEKDDD